MREFVDCPLFAAWRWNETKGTWKRFENTEPWKESVHTKLACSKSASHCAGPASQG